MFYRADISNKEKFDRKLKNRGKNKLHILYDSIMKKKKHVHKIIK